MTALEGLYADHVETLAEHASATLDATGYEKLAIHGGRLVLKSAFDDQDWPFRPVPAVEHWAKVDWPDTTVIVTKGEAPRLAVVRSNSFWERPEEPDWDLIRSGLEVVEVSAFDEVVEMIRGGRVAFVGHDEAVATQLGADANPTPVVDRLHARRTTKTPYEIECMAEASRLAARGHVAARDAFHAGEKSELAIHLAYLAATGLDDPQTPYKNIVALNDAAAILHHIHYRTVDASRSLLIDAGAAHRGYCSDITRTYVTKDDVPGAREFGELIERMDRLQLEIVDAVKVGLEYEALHDLAHVQMGALLVESGLYRGSPDAAVETGVTRKLFPHGLGHSLGVQVHDVGMRLRNPKADNPFLRNTSTIAEGQVFTIEPGLYFIDSFLADLKASNADVDWDRVALLKPFGGIRIEDNVLVTADGHRNLTREAFAAL